MSRLSAEPIVTTAAEEQVLTRLVRAHTTPRKLAERAPTSPVSCSRTGLYHFVLAYSAWEHAEVVLGGESYVIVTC